MGYRMLTLLSLPQSGTGKLAPLEANIISSSSFFSWDGLAFRRSGQVGEGEGMGQVGGIENDQVDATRRDIHRVAEHEDIEEAAPLGCGTLPSLRMGRCPCA